MTCEGKNRCRGYTFDCKDSIACEVTCGEQACSEATILAENAGQLTVIADGIQALTSATIRCPNAVKLPNLCNIVSRWSGGLKKATINALNANMLSVDVTGPRDIQKSLKEAKGDGNHQGWISRCGASVQDAAKRPPRGNDWV